MRKGIAIEVTPADRARLQSGTSNYLVFTEERSRIVFHGSVMVISAIGVGTAAAAELMAQASLLLTLAQSGG
jgi:hypothetical protein